MNNLTNIEIITVAIIGFSLSATCGFRVFVPLLGLSIASQNELINLNSEFDWAGTWPAIIAFSIATILAIIAPALALIIVLFFMFLSYKIIKK